MNFTDEQRAAIDNKGQNIIVSAGAGSGKTAVLTERVIRILKDKVNIDELLILTFTNASALEMKERIRKSIKENPSLKEQLNLLDSAYIGTFDSFSSAIVRKYNYLLNISKNFSIIDANLLNYQKKMIIDNLFEEEYQNNNPVLQNIISSYCDKDDKKIKKFIIELDNKLNLLIDKEKYIDEYISKFYDEDKINNDISLYEKNIFNIIDDIKKNFDMFSKTASAKNTTNLEEYLNPLFQVKSYDELVKINLGSKPSMRGLESELEYKNNIYNALNKLDDYLHFDNKEQIKQAILSNYDFTNFIIKIEKELNKQIMDYKYQNDLFEFNDIAKLAIKVVDENDFVKEELKNKFKEIMIDEYQDTSDLQEKFISLIANNNVYMVGDVKQSIYRFRNANPYIFKDKYDKYKNNNDGIKIDLTSNFRSREEVINDINLIFLNLMNDQMGGADYIEHQMSYGNHVYDKSNKENYSLDILNYNKDDNYKYKDNVIEAFIIAKDIKNKISNNFEVYDKKKDIFRPSTYKDYVILIDRATSFDMYKKIFEYFNLPLEIYNDEKITDDILFMILKNILRVINKIKNDEYDEEFRYLMTSILRSPLREMSDQEIFKMFVDDNFKDNDIYQKCLELTSYYDNRSIKELSLEIIDRFNFYDALIKIGNIKNSIAKIEYFLNNADSFSNMGYSIEEFVNYLNDILDDDNDIKVSRLKDNGDAIKIMTIHASKGLEYPVCYYAGLSTKTNRDELKNSFIFDPELGIIAPYDLDGLDSTIYKDLYKDKYLKEEISERIRLFYVALTRAREKMIIVTKNLEEDIKDDMASFSDFLRLIYNKISNKVINIDLADLDLNRDYNAIKGDNYKNHLDKSDVVLNVDEINIINDVLDTKTYSKHHIELIDQNTKNNMEFGLKAHECLELIDLKNPDYTNIDNFVKNKIINMLNQDIFKSIKDANIYKEYEFMYEDDNNIYHGIIDLMLVYDDHVDIIDYKLKNIDDEAYLQQLNGYKKYIEKKLNKNTNIYLYSIMDNVLNKL